MVTGMSERDWAIAEVLALAKAYYDVDGNEAGGCLHVVLDDENCEDEYVDYCIKFAAEHGDAEGEKLGRILRTLSLEQREEVAKGIYPR